MEPISFRSNLVLDVDPAIFLNGESAYEFPLFNASNRTNEIQNTVTVGGNPTTQTITVQSKNFSITSLRAYINIISLPPVPPYLPSATEDDFTFSVKAGENDMNYPGVAMDLILKVGDLRAITSQFRLQNKRPGYFINLMRFITNESRFYCGLNTSLIIRFRDIGDGLPRMDDKIFFYGDVEESGYFLPLQSIESQSSIVLSGSINAALSGAIASGGSGGGGEPIDPSFKAAITYSNFDNQFILYFLPSYDPSQTADFGNAYSWSIGGVSGELTDLTPYLTQCGSGFYFFAASHYQVEDRFNDALSLTSDTIQPSDRASIIVGQGLDPARSHTVAVGLYAVHVTNPQVEITLQFSI